MRYISTKLTEAEYSELMRSIYNRREQVLRDSVKQAPSIRHSLLAALDGAAKKMEHHQLRYVGPE